MKYALVLFPETTADAIERIQQTPAEFETTWVSNRRVDAFLALSLASAHVPSIGLGANLHDTFDRSPMVTAQLAWDLQSQSEGRLRLNLGMGQQARPVIPERKEANPALDRLRDYIGALRAIWDTFQTDARFRYRGPFYELRLMAPFFNPGPIDHPTIPLYIEGRDEASVHLAGELADGVQGPRLHSAKSLQELFLPALEAGLAAAGRDRASIDVVVPALAVTGADAADFENNLRAARGQIARIVAAPASRDVMAFHGWAELPRWIRESMQADDQQAVGSLITDEVFETLVTIAPPGELKARLEARYGGIVDHLSLPWAGNQPAPVLA
jgi:probable F420-dependent oxidoreductase